jgi:hypothetical protein
MIRIALACLLLTGCYTDQEQFDFAKQCLDAGLRPQVSSQSMACYPIERAK